ALERPDSLDIPLSRVRNLEVRRRWDFATYLSLTYADANEVEQSFAFMSKLALNRRELDAFHEAFEEARSRV
ncbi:MAG: hypothetical protein AAGF12_43475, partial [Myxococcota bacterium]